MVIGKKNCCSRGLVNVAQVGQKDSAQIQGNGGEGDRAHVSGEERGDADASR